MEKFLDDYDEEKRQGRSGAAELPTIPFLDQSFDLAVCSHFLFLYTEHLSAAFHHSAIQELYRVAREVRVFPCGSWMAQTSPYVASIVKNANDSWEVSPKPRAA